MKYTAIDRMKAVKILEKAKALFGKKGQKWTKGALWDGSGYCALGAINKAASSDAMSVDTYTAMESVSGIVESDATLPHAIAINALLTVTQEPIHYFNDADARTFDEVVKAFEKAACNIKKQLLKENAK